MNKSLNKSLLLKLEKFTEDRMGLQFSGSRLKDLEQGIHAVAKKLQFDDANTYGEWLVSTPLTQTHIEILASHLTIGETYFFRDKKYFQLLEKILLPQLITHTNAHTKRLRIWSAGCSTGEEPYSIAISVSKVLLTLEAWQVTLLATDINPLALAQLHRGVYRPWSFRDVASDIKQNYFLEREHEEYQIKPYLKNLVTPAFLNLALDAFPSVDNNTNAMDIIFCRNVLMYFTPTQAAKVTKKLIHCLAPGGYLIVSPCECGQAYFSELTPVNLEGMTIYQNVPRPARVIFQEPVKFVPAAAPIKAQIKANREESNFSQKNYILAKNYYQTGAYKDVITALQTETAKALPSLPALELLARSHANLGELELAMNVCKQAVALDKANINLLYLYGMILEELKLFDEALVIFKQILYLDHNFVLAHFNLGYILLYFGRSQEANKYFANARQLASHYAPDFLIPESEGMTASRLLELIDLQKNKTGRI